MRRYFYTTDNEGLPNMSEMTIRKAVLSDEKAVINCVNASYEKYIERIGKKPGPMMDDYALLIGEGNVFVGEYAGEIAGIIVLKSFADHTLLDNIAVFPAFQGKGYGKQLITFAENYAVEKGTGLIRLYTNIKMRENIDLYKKLGYLEYDSRSDAGYQRVYLEKKLL